MPKYINLGPMNGSDTDFNLSSALANATGMPPVPAWTVVEDKPEIEPSFIANPYLLFVYSSYDARGGADDFIGGYSTLQLAFQAFEQEKKLHPYYDYMAHIATLDDNGQLRIYLEYRDDHDFETRTISRGWKKPKPEEDKK